jgi:hypothetical protein
MHPLLPKLDNPEYEQVHYATLLETPVAPPHVRTGQGHTYTQTIRDVCEKCNSGWMSGIETATQGVLTPLIQGTPSILTPVMQEQLASWITLKALVIDHEKRGDGVTSIETRHSFMRRGVIPSAMRIWIGYHDTPTWYFSFRRQAATWSLHIGSLASLPRKSPVGHRKNVQAV